MNEYLKFYEKYKISPVVQNIEDFTRHIKRRTNLYRQLSVLPSTIEGRDILEIGPGFGELIELLQQASTKKIVAADISGEVIGHIQNMFPG